MQTAPGRNDLCAAMTHGMGGHPIPRVQVTPTSSPARGPVEPCAGRANYRVTWFRVRSQFDFTITPFARKEAIMVRDASDNPGSNQPDRNPDPITKAPGSHPLGTGIGAAAGGATGVGAALAAGAATGSIAGPAGTAIGAIAGAVVGGLTGKAIGERNDPTEDDSYWREEHRNRPYYKDSYDYDRDLAPAYRYGGAIGANVNDSYPDPNARDTAAASDTASMDTASGDRDVSNPFAAREPDLRKGWDQARGDSQLSYDEAQHAIRDAYDRRNLRLREERLNVGKERVKTGEATIRKEVITEHQQVDVPLQREELVIERRPVSGASGGEVGTIGEAETIRVPLSEERATIAKNTVVTEEVNIGKRVDTRTESVGADLKKEELKVDSATTSTTNRNR